jgi:hypothetical protein
MVCKIELKNNNKKGNNKMNTQELAKKMIKLGIQLNGNSDKETVANWIDFLKTNDKERKSHEQTTQTSRENHTN